jgi:hypothetical protein
MLLSVLISMLYRKACQKAAYPAFDVTGDVTAEKQWGQ